MGAATGRDGVRSGPRDFATGAARRGRERGLDESWVAFRVSWGAADGADARRLLAMVCRRGGIHGHAVGPIVVAPRHSIVGVHSTVADRFAAATRAPDPRNPRVTIRRERSTVQPPGRAKRRS
jgi:ATP-dependent RNA helicase DeaD